MADREIGSLAEPAQGPAPAAAEPTDGAPAPQRQESISGARTPPGELRALAEITALCGLAITQPVLDIIGRSPDFFLFHGASRLDVLLLVAAYTLLPPLPLWGIGALVGLAVRRLAGPADGRAVRVGLHLGTLGLLVAALAIQVGKQVSPLRGVPLAGLALLVGAAAALAYRRWRVTGQVLRVAAVGPLVFVLLFVFASPSSAVVLPGGRAGAGPGAGRGEHPPVVMLVLDEFPLVSLLDASGAIDAERFPNFARLANESTWYRDATGVAGYTPYALPAMLTGRYPTQEQAPHYSRYPDNLFTAFGGAYQIHAQESISQLCPPSACPDRDSAARGGLPTLFRESGVLLRELLSPSDAGARDPEDTFQELTAKEAGTDAVTMSNPQFRWAALDENQPARFTEFLAALRPSDRPTLHFLHLLLPHSPWNYLPSGIRYESPRGMSNDGDGWVELAYQRHLYQVEYTDRLLGETLRRLTETGLYDDALVVVTADHGVSFTPGVQGRGRNAMAQTPGELLWVPLFIKRPGQRAGAVDDRNWEQIDLLPTVADLAGVEVTWRTDGVSAVRGSRPKGDKHYHDKPGQVSLIPGDVSAEVASGRARPVLPAPPRPDLLGRAVAELPTGPAAGSASVHNRDDFAHIDERGGRLPALVHGSVPAEVPDGTLLAIAVNGRIGAVTRVVAPDRGGRRFAALVPDESLFTPGANRLELFQISSDGATLHPLRFDS